jgi:competence protein ComEC
MNRAPKLALIKAIVIVIIIWSFAMLTGFSPSVQRASIMFTFITIGKQSERGYNIYNVLSASAIFQLLINPFAIMEVGFQLSYLAVTGIVMFQKFFYGILYIKNKILDYFWQITCVSIAAQIITFPVGLLYYYQFPLYFFVSNLFVIPAAFIIMLTGTILLAIHPIEEIAFWIGKLLNELIYFMNQCVFAVEQLPYSLIQGLSISIVESWLIYLIIFLFFAYIHLRNSKIIIAITAIFTILTIINTIENIIQHNQKMFVVYSTPKNYAYDFIKGKENILFAENRLTENYSQMQFYVMHNWWNNDIRNHRFSPFYKKHNSSGFSNIHQYKNHIFFLGKQIVIIDEKLPENTPKNKLKVDWIILKNNPKVSIEKVLQHYNFSEIIADGTNSKWQAEKWLSESLNLKIKFTAVNHSGAFVKQL